VLDDWTMIHRFLTVLLVITTLSACSTGGGGTVLPSPSGDAALRKACRDAPPDFLPNTPIKTASLWYNEGVGSSADSLELLRIGFERVSFTASQSAINEAASLPVGDTNRWSKAPLTMQPGVLTLEVAPFGDGSCTAFEREIAGQRVSSDPNAGGDDPMKYWTDTRYPSASPQSRNWCIATLPTPDSDALLLNRSVTTSQEGQSTISVTFEAVTSRDGALLAQRTIVRQLRASFPIGISQVATGCDGNAIGPVPEFWGPTGIALRPASAPTLINK
jgi:hypothetical protein